MEWRDPGRSRGRSSITIREMAVTQAPPHPPTQAFGGAGSMRPHRGGMILALGILGIVICQICGIIAWVMANTDQAEMRAGRMDPSGEGTTNAGKICGIISVVWLVIVIGLFVVGLVGGLLVAGSATTTGG